MAKRRAPRHPDQRDLFEVQKVFEVRAPQALMRALDFNRTIALAMGEAIQACGKSRETICAEMTDLLDYEDGKEMTVAQLNAYTSKARESHTISLVRFKAFVRVTGCNWLWDVLLHDEGLTILEGEEAHLARASLLQKKAEELLAQAKEALNAAPSTVRVPRGQR
ncbi:MAG: hypothetical protein AB1942_19975 [Pseudomonadota bacterium]